MGIVSGGGGGSTYTPPTARGYFSDGNSDPIANGATGFLKWSDQSYPGGPVLDLTVVTAPTVLTSGIYAVSVTVVGSQLTVGGFFTVQMGWDYSGDGLLMDNDSRPSLAGEIFPKCLIAGAYYIPAGGNIKVRVTNKDGAAQRLFTLNEAIVQRLT